MFVSEFLSNANFCLASFTILMYLHVQLITILRQIILQVVAEIGQIGLRLSYNTLTTFFCLRPICKFYISVWQLNKVYASASDQGNQAKQKWTWHHQNTSVVCLRVVIQLFYDSF